MSNENAAVCGCGITVDVSRRKVPVPLPIWRHGKSDGRSSKKQQNDGRGSKNRNSETGSSSSVSDHAKPMTKSSKQEKRLNHQMRSRSVERGKTYYTYIDSNSSILSGGNRETIPEALYVTIPDTPNATANDTGNSLTNSQNRSPLVYTIPSMTSPPPTYDASVAKSWQIHNEHIGLDIVKGVHRVARSYRMFYIVIKHYIEEVLTGKSSDMFLLYLI
ncbi:hypothetical protein HZH68_003786 [Vespula germanica]|uniref:Uncharacterized protein n=1 Tax=Vespula germanica TaxID=30212 RepID=A0A834KMJ1_VESGE|nr:hypothetical protein HZH68_003786 [Vespula germanica]